MNQEMELKQQTWRDSLRHPLVLAAIIIALGIALAGIFYAAANVVPETGAGDGTGTVSGYTISAVAWTVDAVNPSEMDSVTFTVTPTAGASAATEVYATVDGGTTWITCAGGPSWTCTFAAGVLVTAIVDLQIVAVE